mgnify:FL=1
MLIGSTFFVNMAVVWLVAMVALLIVEALVPGLVSIWFAIGAFAALIAALLGAPLWLQVVWFLAVSVATLALTRPLARRYVNSRVQPTNADALIGRDCVVTETIDNLAGTGAVKIDGKVWTARAESEEEKYAVGDVVKAQKIEGVKLIVKK